MRFRENVYRFMGGRYGGDSLNSFIIFFSLGLMAVNLFARTVTLNILVLLLLTVSVFRTFSRNTAARQKELRKFLELTEKVRRRYSLLVSRFKDRKTHVYLTCPNCRKTLRLPKRKGGHTVCCPCCRKDFECRIK